MLGYTMTKSAGRRGGRDKVCRWDGYREEKRYLIDLVCVIPLQTIIADSEQEFDGLRWARPTLSELGSFVIF